MDCVAKLSDVKVEIVDLTPLDAEVLLELNNTNRPMRQSRVEKYCRDMLSGEWMFNGDTVCVAASGHLLNGQHRCAAVVKSGVPMKTILVSNLPDEVFKTIDTGAARTAGDAMNLAGEKNGNVLAAMCLLMHKYKLCGNPFSSNADTHPSTSEHFEILDANPDLRKSATYISGKKWVRRYTSPAQAGFAHYIFNEKDPVMCDDFFQKLDSGIGLSEGSPILLLRDRLVQEKSARDKMPTSYRTALLFKAFRLYRDGAMLKVLRVRIEGDTPEKEVFVV